MTIDSMQTIIEKTIISSNYKLKSLEPLNDELLLEIEKPINSGDYFGDCHSIKMTVRSEVDIGNLQEIIKGEH